MKSLLGLLQIGLGIGGLVAAFSGQWVTVLLCWGGALVLGLLGNRAVQATEGISESGQAALGNIPVVLERLRDGNFDAAHALTMNTVRQFRLGGDAPLLVPALTLHAVTSAAVGKMEAARQAIAEARQRVATLPPAIVDDFREFREMLLLVEYEISRGSKPKRIVRKFLEMNDDE